MTDNNADHGRIIERIQKLLTLGSNNPSQNEAESAIMKAHRLMAQHGIQEVDLESSQRELTYTTFFCEHKGDKMYRRNLGHIIADNFRCRFYLQDGQVAFFGRSDDAAAARTTFEFTYRFISRESDRLYRKRRNEGFSGSGIVNSYALGFLQGLREKLDQQSTALMVVVPRDVQERYAELSKKFTTKKTRIRVSKVDYDAYEQGQADGRTALGKRQLPDAG